MKSNKGITLIALTITIVVLLILAGISISGGSKLIRSSNLENLITNMLLIKTKAKQYVENANFKLGTSFNTLSKDGDKTTRLTRLTSAKGELIGTDITSDIDKYSDKITKKTSSGTTNLIFYYKLSENDLETMGLNNSNFETTSGEYIVEYDIENATVEVYNTEGFTNKNNETKYSLTDLQNMQDAGNVD